MGKNIALKVALQMALKIGMGISLAAMLPLQMTQAASGDGSLVGQLTASDKSSLEGTEVTVRNPETGFSRTVKADADGRYRFPFLPVGKYIVEASKGGNTLGKLADVTVGLGAATTADVTLNVANLEEVQVVGTRIVTMVDVKSTESATNITREELARFPVERDAISVALLAPGLVRGDKDLGDGTGISFGGSSIAENTAYINGLNVTDFYNRVGFSAVPYAFYKEFQIKTGGYSVEFGRTTGGVINAVTRSGTNEFDFGSEIAWEPDFLQTAGSNRYTPSGQPNIIRHYDEYDRSTATAYASGPIIKDKLFFFALYEARDYKPTNTNDVGNRLDKGDANDAFWGAKVDWQINDKNLLELLAFSDKDDTATDNYAFDLSSGTRGAYQNTSFENNGGTNWAATYTVYLTDDLSGKALYGENKRKSNVYSVNDVNCNRIRDRQEDIGQDDVGCTKTASVADRADTREEARLDFEWALGDHQLRFGLDHETNTSDYTQFYPGPGRLLYEINTTSPGASLANGGVVPAGVTAYVRTRRSEVDGEFESINSAYYLEDNWSATQTLVLNAGVRVEAFDNRNSEGDTYIKMDNMIAPRFGFAWDVKGDSRKKIFGNAGRYFLPVANVINIKQAGGFLDERTFYVFNGFENFQYNGQTYQRPKLGPQIGPVDTSQGDGTVGDLRGEVDKDMDAVYQDELILGFQGMIDDRWSWGARGIYRKLHNAIDDMAITSNGILCGGKPGSVGFVMGNPGETLTVYTDTNCDGENDGYVNIDTSKAGWALYDDDGNYVGERGYTKPRRDYKALELVIDRAWDDQWAFNASYTLAFSKGNAEGPVNSDTNFSDTGRTENFDDPWVNLNAYGYLPNDRRHQFKFRGAYALTEQWQFGATLNVQSGRPISELGSGNPFDGTVYHSFYICVQNCSSEVPSERVYELHKRGSGGRTPWTFDLNANVSWKYDFSAADLLVKLSVYNLLNQERVVQVDEQLERNQAVGDVKNALYGIGTGYQSPRYAQLTVTLDF
jgi:hypothetical protein